MSDPDVIRFEWMGHWSFGVLGGMWLVAPWSVWRMGSEGVTGPLLAALGASLLLGVGGPLLLRSRVRVVFDGEEVEVRNVVTCTRFHWAEVERVERVRSAHCLSYNVGFRRRLLTVFRLRDGRVVKALAGHDGSGTRRWRRIAERARRRGIEAVALEPHPTLFT